MATEKFFYLDKAGLAQYDALIKQYVDDADALAIKYITYDTATTPTTLSFWKVDPTEAGATAAYTVTFPDASTLMTVVSGATAGHIATLDANGQVVDSGLAKDDVIRKSGDTGASFTAGQVAVFGTDTASGAPTVKGLTLNATAVPFDDTTAHTGSNTVQGAIDSIAQATGGGVAAKTVYITETAGGSSDIYSKRYGVYQGGEGSAQSPVPAELLANIDIPKDMVVEEGSVVDITYSNGHLYDGATDVTEIIKGSESATAADAGKYIKLVIANSASTVIYIKATDLVDIYTGGTTADGTISISASNEITFTLSQTVHGSLALANTSLQPVTTATADNIVTFDANGGIQDSGVSIDDVATGIEDIIAPAFSDQSTYALGDYVIYDGKLYECTTAVTVAGSWVAANWTESKVMTSFQPIPSQYISSLFNS